MGYIYKITNKIDNKVYIGQTKRAWDKRVNEHLDDGDNEDMKADLKKYGMEGFTFECIEKIPNEQLNEREKYWIKYYDSKNNGYNNTVGGAGTPQVDYDLVKQKYDKGQTRTEIAKDLHILVNTVSHILQSFGYENDRGKKKVNCYDLQGHYLRTYNSITDAVRDLDLPYSATTQIPRVCKDIDKCTKTHGYMWRYYTGNTDDLIIKPKELPIPDTYYQIAALYDTGKYTRTQISEIVCVDRHVVTRALRRLGYADERKPNKKIS